MHSTQRIVLPLCALLHATGWLLHKLGRYHKLQLVNAVCVLSTFFVFRILWGPYLSYRFFMDSSTMEPFRHFLYVKVLWVLMFTLNGLNFYWFYLMVRKAYHMFSGPQSKSE